MKKSIGDYAAIGISLFAQALIGVVFTTIITSVYNAITVSVLSCMIIVGVCVYYNRKCEQSSKSENEAKENADKVQADYEKAVGNINLFEQKIHEYENMGIVECVHELQGTKYEPDYCMRNVHNQLDFMGVGGAKWVEQTANREKFEKMLERIGSRGNGKVRFLLLDPEKESYKKLRRLRDNAVPESSYGILKELAETHACLEVHLYNTLPTFRLQFVDRSYVAVSRYFVGREEFNRYGHGWQNPHLIVNAEREDHAGSREAKQHASSLYGSFELLYQYIWDHSRDIGELNTDTAFKVRK